MSTIKEITSLCKSGHLKEGYELAKSNYVEDSQNVWAQRGLAWALYYLLKEEHKKKDDFLIHLEEFGKLDLLSEENDSMIFNNLIWKVAMFVDDLGGDVEKMNRIYQLIKQFSFKASDGYSFLLRSSLVFEDWSQLPVFIEWWNLDNLLAEDYNRYETEKGKKIMSLAERAYLAYSKAILNLDDKEKITLFLPKLQNLMDKHPEMVFLGYYCGKMMIALNANKQETIQHVMPFVRKKKTETWVWQMLSEIYDDIDIQMACLLRASHCQASETFKGRVRTTLASLYKAKNDLPRAKSQLLKVVKCYQEQDWNLPKEAWEMLSEPWVKTTSTDESDPIDYVSITDNILIEGLLEAIAVVTCVDNSKSRMALVYGYKKRDLVRLPEKRGDIRTGIVMKIWYSENEEGRIRIIRTDIVDSITDEMQLYCKKMSGIVRKNIGKAYAFLHTNVSNVFVSPEVVKKYNVHDNELLDILAVYDYNKKKDEWNWTCLSIYKN